VGTLLIIYIAGAFLMAAFTGWIGEDQDKNFSAGEVVLSVAFWPIMLTAIVFGGICRLVNQ
jgi:hypothetical protein